MPLPLPVCGNKVCATVNPLQNGEFQSSVAAASIGWRPEIGCGGIHGLMHGPEFGAGASRPGWASHRAGAILVRSASTSRPAAASRSKRSPLFQKFITTARYRRSQRQGYRLRPHQSSCYIRYAADIEDCHGILQIGHNDNGDHGAPSKVPPLLNIIGVEIIDNINAQLIGWQFSVAQLPCQSVSGSWVMV